jgi:hypothetical protein
VGFRSDDGAGAVRVGRVLTLGTGRRSRAPGRTSRARCARESVGRVAPLGPKPPRLHQSSWQKEGAVAREPFLGDALGLQIVAHCGSIKRFLGRSLFCKYLVMRTGRKRFVRNKPICVTFLVCLSEQNILSPPLTVAANRMRRSATTNSLGPRKMCPTNGLQESEREWPNGNCS